MKGESLILKSHRSGFPDEKSPIWKIVSESSAFFLVRVKEFTFPSQDFQCCSSFSGQHELKWNMSRLIHIVVCTVYRYLYIKAYNSIGSHSLNSLICPPQLNRKYQSIISWPVSYGSAGPLRSLISVNTSRLLINAPICVMHVRCNIPLHLWPTLLCLSNGMKWNRGASATKSKQNPAFNPSIYSKK